MQFVVNINIKILNSVTKNQWNTGDTYKLIHNCPENKYPYIWQHQFYFDCEPHWKL